ncbi:MAG: LPS export ABC transporter permease LptF [Rhodocyclaceae bacterium]|nr:LPS export ABC transporter permease LptF [Rhodocyclaceae bacterium]
MLGIECPRGRAELAPGFGEDQQTLRLERLGAPASRAKFHPLFLLVSAAFPTIIGGTRARSREGAQPVTDPAKTDPAETGSAATLAAEPNTLGATPRASRKPLIASLFSRRISGECASVALGVFAVLFGIIVTAHLVRLLNRAARGGISVDTVLAAMSFQTLNLFPLVLALTVFIATLVALTRAHRDSEMVIWFACGMPLRAFIVPLLRFALPFVGLVAVLTLAVRPWAVTRSLELQSELQSRDEIALVAPGVFKETRSGTKVYFVERFSDFGQSLAEVFIRSADEQGESITVAHSGDVTRAANGDRFLVLRDGHRYESGNTPGSWRMTLFKQADILIQPYEKQGFNNTAKSTETLALFGSDRPGDIAELQWRFHMPIASLLLVLLAVPLGFVNPRARRSINLALAVLIYALYSNALSVTNAWVAQGRLAPWPGFCLVHLALIGVVVALLAWQTGAYKRWRQRA